MNKLTHEDDLSVVDMLISLARVVHQEAPDPRKARTAGKLASILDDARAEMMPRETPGIVPVR